MYCTELNTVLNKKNFLGKGLFSKAYRVGDEVIIVTLDPAKECLALFTVENIHLPELTTLEDIGEKRAYKMLYYEALTAQHKEAWEQYKLLKKVIDTVRYNHPGKYKCYEVYRELVNTCEGLKESIKEAVNSLLDGMANYTENVFIEVSPRNLKVNENGELILLDIIGDTNLLLKMRK